jgi:glycosyltransferase involved in cell wall biosynthesis
VRKFRECEIDILCIGGEPEINPTALAGLPRNVSARRVELTDQDLACAYSGAEALIYPSLYEGFGMPVVEAMACGCPVITTRHGSLGEVSGEAAVFVSGHDADELRCAMALVRDANERKKLIERGLRRAARYSWDDTARGVYNLLERAREERYDPAMKDFFAQWKKLRAIQAEVDVGC